MATTVAALQAVLDADTSKFDRGVASADRKFGGLSKGIVTGAKVAGAAIAGLGVAAAIGAKKSIDAASDLNESVNAVEVVFGKASEKIHTFSVIAAQEAGLSMRELNQLVTPVGAALRNVGFSADEAAESSINLAKRAADMASVFNVDVDEAMQAIQAGLRGEADPLEKFGVGLNEAALQAYAVKKGMVDANTELTNAQKVQARLGLVFEQTNRLQGDFVNTSDGLANSQRILRAEFENVTAEVGTALLPVATKLVGLLADLIPVVRHVAGIVIDKLRPAFEKVSDSISEHSGTIHMVFETVRDFITDHLVPAFFDLRDHVKEVVQKIVQVFTDHKKDLTEIWNNLSDIIKIVWEIFKDDLLPIIRTVLPKALEVAIPVVRRMSDAMKVLASWTGAVANAIEDVVGFFNKIPGADKGLLELVGITGDGSGIGFAGAVPAANPGGLVPNILDDLGLAQNMGLTLSSGFRPGAVTSSGNPSLHASGRAIDVVGSGPAMRSFFGAEVYRAAVTGLQEIIHSPYWWHPGSGVTRITDSAVMAGHWNHVHVGTYDKGGFLRPGWNLAYNGLGRPEPVGGGGITVVLNGTLIDDRAGEKVVRMLEDWQRRGGRMP